MSNSDDKEMLQQLRDAFNSVVTNSALNDYPKEAMKLGTLVKTHRHNRLGVITDAFYGELDADNKRIIIYTILLFPKVDMAGRLPKSKEQYYLTNEYEYEVTGYLMMKPVDLVELTKSLGGGLYL